jgi:aldehyde:ferredoxin oxidoreductase
LPTGRAEGRTAFVNEEDFIESRRILYEKRGLDKDGIPTTEELARLHIR